MVTVDWRTLLAGAFLLLAAAVLVYRWSESEPLERLGGTVLLVGVAIDVREEALVDGLGLGGSVAEAF